MRTTTPSCAENGSSAAAESDRIPVSRKKASSQRSVRLRLRYIESCQSTILIAPISCEKKEGVRQKEEEDENKKVRKKQGFRG
jgi:hypothetical protein